MTFTANDGGTATFRDVKVTATELTASITTEGDPPALKTRMKLQRVTEPKPAARTAGGCADLGLPPEIKQVLAAAASPCPIPIPSNEVEAMFTRRLVEDLVIAVFQEKPVVNITDFTAALPHGFYGTPLLHGWGIHVGSVRNPEMVGALLRPLFTDPEHVLVTRLPPGRCPPGLKCALEMASYEEFKPIYRRGGRIDLGRVWTAMVRIAGRHNLQFPPMANLREYRLVSEFTPVAANENGLIYQVVTLQLRDLNPSAPGRQVELYVGAQVWRKAAISVKRPVKIDQECQAKTGDDFGFRCLDMAMMRELRDELFEKVAGGI